MGIWNISRREFDVVALKVALNNPLTRKYILNSLREKNGKTVLEETLDHYSASNFGFSPLELVRKALRIEKEEFASQLKRPMVRRVIIAAFKSVKEYGLQFPQTFSVPLMVVWNITNRCNLKCIHCYQSATASGTKDELTLEEKMAVLDQIAEAGIPTLAFAGGEPLMDKDFWKVVERAREKDFYISLNTNGTLLTPENVARIKELGFAYVGVSLDAATEKEHDAFRGVPGMFSKTMAGIRNLIKAGLQDITCLSYTWSKRNCDQLPEMIKLRDRLGLRKLVVYNFIPCGRAGFDNDLTASQREKGYQIMYQDAQENPGKLLCTAPQFGRYCFEKAKENNNEEGEPIVLSHFGTGRAKLGVLSEIIGGCGAGRAYLALQPNGDLSPCVFMPDTRLGNIKKKNSLLEVWKEAPLLKEMRERKRFAAHCGRCLYRSLCGGCRARAYAYTRKYTGADPGCINNTVTKERNQRGLFLFSRLKWL